MAPIQPFRIAVPDDVLTDLKDRLQRTRWPEAECVDDWSQGIPLAYTRELADYWANEYDWRAREATLNRFDQFTTDIDGLPIHFIHQRCTRADAFPLIITHGWPGSIVEFHKVIEPLNDAGFDVVCPSLPGYGFSGKPTEITAQTRHRRVRDKPAADDRGGESRPLARQSPLRQRHAGGQYSDSAVERRVLRTVRPLLGATPAAA